jgi:hypothetical protein
VFSEVFTGEEVDGIRGKGSGHNPTVEVQTILEACLNMSLRSTCFTHKAFFWQKQKIPVLGLLSSCAGSSGFPDIGIKEFCYTYTHTHT